MGASSTYNNRFRPVLVGQITVPYNARYGAFPVYLWRLPAPNKGLRSGNDDRRLCSYGQSKRRERENRAFQAHPKERLASNNYERGLAIRFHAVRGDNNRERLRIQRTGNTDLQLYTTPRSSCYASSFLHNSALRHNRQLCGRSDIWSA